MNFNSYEGFPIEPNEVLLKKYELAQKVYAELDAALSEYDTLTQRIEQAFFEAEEYLEKTAIERNKFKERSEHSDVNIDQQDTFLSLGKGIFAGAKSLSEKRRKIMTPEQYKAARDRLDEVMEAKTNIKKLLIRNGVPEQEFMD